MYITANALSSQAIYSVSNFYLNLAKYLNKDFHAFDTLMAENFYNIDDFVNSKKQDDLADCFLQCLWFIKNYKK